MGMPMTQLEKQQKAKLLFEQAKDALGKGEVQIAEGLLAEASDLKKQVEQGAELLKTAQGQLDELTRVEQKSGSPLTPGQRWKFWGEFLTAVEATNRKERDPRLQRFVDHEESQNFTRTKDMSGNSGEAGGYLIPEEFVTEIYGVLAETGIVRSHRPTLLPMRRRSIKVPVVDQPSTPAGQPHWFGGMVFDWEDEASEITSSDLKFKEVELTARKLTALTRSSEELMDDAAVSLEAFLQSPRGFAGGAVWMEDYAFLNGNGVGKPLGVIGSPCTKAVSRATTSHVKYTDLVNMLAAALMSDNLIWVANTGVLSELMLMEGPSGHPVYLWGNATAGVPDTLLGRPIVFTEKVPALGTKGDIGLYDFSYYLVGDRQAPTVESTNYEKWAEDKTSWKLRHRVAGQPWLEAPLTLQDGSTQVSPFVVVAA